MLTARSVKSHNLGKKLFRKADQTLAFYMGFTTKGEQARNEAGACKTVSASPALFLEGGV